MTSALAEASQAGGQMTDEEIVAYATTHMGILAGELRASSATTAEVPTSHR